MSSDLIACYELIKNDFAEIGIKVKIDSEPDEHHVYHMRNRQFLKIEFQIIRNVLEDPQLEVHNVYDVMLYKADLPKIYLYFPTTTICLADPHYRDRMVDWFNNTYYTKLRFGNIKEIPVN